MILLHGDTEKLKGQDWWALELTTERAIQPTIHRLARAVPGVMGRSPCELFIPVVRRDLGVFELSTGNLLYARGDVRTLGRLRLSCTGITGLLTSGDTNRMADAMPVPDGFVQGQIAECKRLREKEHEGIKAGSFVRVLDGVCRDFCGTIDGMEGGCAVVRVELLDRVMFVETPVANLLNLNDVPRSHRVFYYSPLIDVLPAEALTCDLKHSDPPAYIETKPDYGKPRWRSPGTFSAAIRRTSAESPRVMAEKLAAMLADGRVTKKPKNLYIVYGLVKRWWTTSCGGKRYDGEKDGLTLASLCAIFAGAGIPKHTPTSSIARDGRAASARKLKKPMGLHGEMTRSPTSVPT